MRISARSMRAACGLSLVVVAPQVQHAVHHQVRVVRRERFSLLPRFARDHRMAEHDVAAQRPCAVGES